MHEFWISGSQARVDMVFAACIAVALAGFFFWYRDGHRRTRATCYVASASLTSNPKKITTKNKPSRRSRAIIVLELASIEFHHSSVAHLEERFCRCCEQVLQPGQVSAIYKYYE